MKSNAWITWKSIGILKNFMVGGNVVTSAAMNFEDDGRLQYLCNYVCVSMKVKAEKWMKLLMTDEHRVRFQSGSYIQFEGLRISTQYFFCE